jgi:hypothetical protein
MPREGIQVLDIVTILSADTQPVQSIDITTSKIQEPGRRIRGRLHRTNGGQFEGLPSISENCKA